MMVLDVIIAHTTVQAMVGIRPLTLVGKTLSMIHQTPILKMLRLTFIRRQFYIKACG